MIQTHGTTVLMISHRLSTIAQTNRILVFNEGKIVEKGSHDFLLNLSGHYRHMWETQLKGFLPHAPR